MLKSAAIVIGLLPLAGTAEAEFTSAEQASLRHLYAGITWATDSYYPREVVNRMTNSTTRPKIANAVELHQKALRATTEALGALLGADIRSAAFRIRMADAWQHTDQGAWMLMVFPDCSVLTNPTGCGGL